MKDLSEAAPALVKKAIQVIKSIGALRRRAEGLCEVLHMQPSQASLEIHQEVLGSSSQSDTPPRSRRPIKRAVDEAAAAEEYEPPAKKAEVGAGENEPLI